MAGHLRTDGAKFQSNTIAEIPFSESLGSVERLITIMAWVNRDEILNNSSVFTNDYPNMFFGFHNSLYKWEFDTDQGKGSCYAGFTPVGQWVHIAATYDGNVARMYANGVEICAVPVTGNIRITSTDPESDFNAFSTSGFYERRTPAQIGEPTNNSGVTDEIDGRIDELKVYNQVLSAAQIKAAFQLGEVLPEVPDCPEGTIVAEFRMGTTGPWSDSANINASEGQEVYIRAKDFAGDYIVTTPEVDGETFFSTADFDVNLGYQVDTGTRTGDNDGLIDVDDMGQYVLTTTDGCPVAINLTVVGSCDPGDTQIESEFRINGDFNTSFNGQTDLSLEEGTDLWISATPNEVDGANLGISITLPNGDVVGDNYIVGPVSETSEGTYIITSDEGCSVTVTLTVTDVDCASFGLQSEYKINDNAFQIDVPTATISEGGELTLSVSPENIVFTVTAPNGTNVYSGSTNFVIDNVNSTDHDGVFTLTTGAGCSVTVDVTVEPVDCADVMTEYQIDSGVFQIGESAVTVEENSRLTLSIAPNDIPFTVTLPDGSIENVRAGRDYVIEDIQIAQSGLYSFNTPVSDCTVTLDVTVGEINCDAVVTEYRINQQPFQVDEPVAELDEGSMLTLSIEPDDAPYTITFPDGSVENVAANTDLIIDAVDQTHNGDFLLTAQNGCEKTLMVIVNAIDCSEVVSEYRIGTAPYVSGASEVTVDEGEQLILSVFPNNLPYTITEPSGTVTNFASGVENDTIASVSQADAGLYIFTTTGTGCSVDLNVTVNNPICTALNLRPEYSVDGGVFVEAMNGEEVILDTGASLVLSALPDEDNGAMVPIIITLPDGTEVGDNYEISSLTADDEGSYLFTTDTGCTTSLNITVNSNEIDCTALNLLPEYSVNGGAVQTGTNGGTLTIIEGDAIVLSASPDDFNGLPVMVTINLPDTSMQSDGYEITSATTANSGTYTFTNDTGCTATLELEVTPSNIDCTAVNLVPEYIINAGMAQAGTDGETLNLNEGDALIISALPKDFNGLPVNVTITLPDGSTQADGYEIASLTAADSGLYTLNTDTGCTAAFNLVVGGEECTPNSITAEYVVNNQTTQSGGESVLLTVGDNLILRIVQDDAFTITLPDGSEVTGEYTIESVAMSDAGVYTFTSALGCTTEFGVSVMEEGGSDGALKDLVLYPNPVRDGMLHFALEDFMNQEIRVQINDIYGKTILRQIFNAAHESDEVIDISIINEGIYIVIITRNTDNEIAFKKIIKLGGL